MLQKLLFMHGACGKLFVEETATGNPATFTTDLAKPLVSLIAPFTPIQAGSGDPSPTNVRAISGFTGITAYRTGKNLFNCVQSDYSADGWNRYFTNPMKKAGTYTVSCGKKFGGNGQQGGKIFFVDARSNTAVAIGNSITPNYGFGDVSFTVTATITEEQANAPYIKFGMNSANSTFADFENAQLQFEVGETASAYEACIGATFPVAFPALGKNLFDGQYPDIKTTSALTYRALYVGDGTFTASTNMPLGEYGSLFFLPGNVSTGASTGGNNVNLNVPRTATAVDGYVTIAYRAFGTDPREYNVQIEKGSSATAYEPYTNTAYGGSLDLVSGVLTVTHKYVALNDASLWKESSGSIYTFYYDHNFTDRGKGESSYYGVICSYAPIAYSTASGAIYGRWYSQTSGTFGIMARSGATIDLDDVKTAAGNNEIAICYELATPQTIQLDPVTIQTLIGSNTIWTDTNGTNEITYMKKG